MSKVDIFFIYTENCPDCDAAKREIEAAMKESEIECNPQLFNSEDRIAVNIAITNEISNIPACVIGGGVAVFQGTDFHRADIVEAIKKANSNSLK